MSRVEKTVFISYRRTNLSWALALSQSLTHNGFDVFVDFTGLNSGNFEQAILENIRSRAHFLIILTPSALDRCSEDGDWLRLEIEEAMDCERNIIPLILDNFDFGAPTVASKLTGKLALLKNYNALSVPGNYFYEAMARLREQFLNVALDAVLHPISEIAKQTAVTEKAATAAPPKVSREGLTAEIYFEQGFGATDPDEKLRFYTEALNLDANLAEAYYYRGNVRDSRGDYDEAIADYTKALWLNPKFTEATEALELLKEKTGLN